MRLQLFKKINNVERLSKIIFFNFIHLQYENDINFSIDDIRDTLSSNELLGWFLLNDNNKIVGYLIGIRKEVGDGRFVYYINYFYIIQNYRRKGLGAKMLLYCIQYIKSINIRFIMLISEINSDGYNLYKNFGFLIDPIIKINNPNHVVLLYYC